jgi:methanogenic corrinoid protein MtbC1
MDISNFEKIVNVREEDPLSQLKKSIATYNKGLAIESFKRSVEEKINPLIILENITEVMTLIGEAYEDEYLFLPDLIGASDTMSAVMPFIESEILKRGVEIKAKGIIILGTVLGDIHTIGKQMVGTLLTADGFSVYDIGVNVSADRFIDAIKTYNADILAMSALLTTTAYEQKKVIRILEEENLRKHIKIMVGGGAVNEEFACNIGADGYEPTATGAVKLARKLMEK